MALGDRYFKNWISLQLNTKKKFKYTSSVCCANFHNLLKCRFGIFLCSMFISLLNVSKLLQNGHFPIFSLFGGHFVTIATIKSN